MTEYDNELKKFVLERRPLVGRWTKLCVTMDRISASKKTNDPANFFVCTGRIWRFGVCWDCSANKSLFFNSILSFFQHRNLLWI